MKISVKVSFPLFLLLLAKHGYTMDLPGWRQAENGGITKRAICTHSPYPYFNFHDLRHYSQTNQQNNKRIMEYFNENKVVVDYFKVLHRIMATSSQPDQKKLWDLAKIAAVYDAKVQCWILSYAINYINDHFLIPFRQKEMNPRFHQWIYVIRSFQGCDANFKADSFIKAALSQHLDCLNHINSMNKLKDRGYYYDFDPRETIKNLKIVKTHSFDELKKSFIGGQGCFFSLCLYSSNQEICLGYEDCSKLRSPGDEKLLGHPIDLLLMRRDEKSIKTIAYRLIMEEGTPSWFLRTKSFLKSYNRWNFTIPFGDGDMKRGIEELSNLMSKKGVLLIPPWEPGDKAKNRKRNRSASLT